MEIHLSDRSEPPQVVRDLNGSPQVKISTDLEIEGMLEQLQIALTPEEYHDFLNLWQNDLHLRSYSKEGNYLIIKSQN